MPELTSTERAEALVKAQVRNVQGEPLAEVRPGAVYLAGAFARVEEQRVSASPSRHCVTASVRITPVSAGAASSHLRGLLDRVKPQPTGLDTAAPRPAADRDIGPIQWFKIADPLDPAPSAIKGVDTRVLLPDSDQFAKLIDTLKRQNIPVRTVRHWIESETITSVRAGTPTPLTSICRLTTNRTLATAPTTGAGAVVAAEAFELMWDAHAESGIERPVLSPAERHLPHDWLPYLPFATLNPAQVQAAPHVADADDHVLVTAPTGAGKTVIGMMAALRTILKEGRKAAWLVPQRSLTDELDRELNGWRRQGLRVERLSGEYVVDAQKVRDADLWVATTEKFESMCRASSLREALADVGCLIVDEIHLLGDRTRGPVLEALLARVRGDGSPVRVVGLSATVANAAQIADWLGAHHIPITWRPSRLTWQLPLIATSLDRAATQTARTHLATTLTEKITGDGGSVLVFCGSKRGVRSTALAIAASRSANISGVDPDDAAAVERTCTQAGVGLHYSDWEHKRAAEHAFRNRDIDVLVATSTVAAGVNLPARAVVIRDTTVGIESAEVALVQQMFGRAGRIGAGETEGWAYLIVDENERALWQAKLADGYRVVSKILDTLPDHVLAETVQGRINTLREAEAWWIQTLAHHQGADSLNPLHAAIDLLTEGGYLTSTPAGEDDSDLAATDLGTLTTRLMVAAETGLLLRAALAKVPLPAKPAAAERLLINHLALLVPDLAEAAVTEEIRGPVARLLQAGGDLTRLGATRTYRRRGGLASAGHYTPGDLAQAALLTLATTPRAFEQPGRLIAGIPYTAMRPLLEKAAHHLTWLAAQGYLGTVHPWIAIVASDLAHRATWHRLGPPRGSGRLLWMCAQMATPLHADREVPLMWRRATSRGITHPDWPVGAAPTGCRLDRNGYTALLRDRITGIDLTPADGDLEARCAPGTAVTTWTGLQHTQMVATTDHLTLPHPTGPQDAARGTAAFSRRGDLHATGWLTPYNSADLHTP
ncbi:hypothetical protein GCM10027589_15050 [Actinocorallia lasiicapitis]